jgi:hypothetical protein
MLSLERARFIGFGTSLLRTMTIGTSALPQLDYFIQTKTRKNGGGYSSGTVRSRRRASVYQPRLVWCWTVQKQFQAKQLFTVAVSVHSTQSRHPLPKGMSRCCSGWIGRQCRFRALRHVDQASRGMWMTILQKHIPVSLTDNSTAQAYPVIGVDDGRLTRS